MLGVTKTPNKKKTTNMFPTLVLTAYDSGCKSTYFISFLEHLL